MFFGGFLCRSNYDRKKRYSHLADGWNKSQITVCRVKIRTPPITLLFKKILIGFLYFGEILDRGILFLRNTLLLYSLSPYSQTERQTEKHIILVGLGNLRFLQVNPGWAG